MRSELSRLRFRRRAWGSLIIMLLAGLIIPSTWMTMVTQPSDSEVIIAGIQATRANLVGECDGCTASSYLVWWTFQDTVTHGLTVGGLGLAFISFMIVITYVGADFSSGALSTQLTFTPRRVSVLTARTLACGVLGALLMAVGMLTMAAVTIIGFLLVNPIESIGTAPGLLGVLIGGIVYGAFIGMLASLVSFVIPHTTIAMAVTLVALAFNFFVWNDSQWAGPREFWRLLPSTNAEAMLAGVSRDNALVGGMVTRLDALVFHSVLILILFAIAAFLFERRDIKG